MSQADNLAALGSNVNASGVLQPAGGGTGATTSTGTGNAVLSISPTISSPTLINATINGAVASGFTMKNRIINGDMQVWQRGTSITTGGAYTADRWNEVSGNSNQHIRSTDVPTNFGFSMQIIGVGANMNQRIESLNCQDLSGQTVTISFWVKNTSGTDSLGLQLYHCNAADNFASLTQIGSTVTISSNPSSTWTQYTTTFTNLPSGSKNGLSLYIYRTGTGAVSTTWFLTGVQLEAGSQATSFEWIPYSTELQLCQRYYWQGGNGFSGVFSGPTLARFSGSYPVPMRATPTVTAIAAPSALNPTVAEQQIGSQTLNFAAPAAGLIGVAACSKIQFGGFASAVDGRASVLTNDCLAFTSEL
jgi:hypothetical protein